MQQKRFLSLVISCIGILGLVGLYSCSKSTITPSNNPNNTFTYDGFTYHTVTIGNITFTVENAQVNHYRNGKNIRHALTNAEWKDSTKTKTFDKGAWCYYKHTNNVDSQQRYGKLYNWYAVNDNRGLAPQGWHVVSNDDLDKLISQLIKGQEGQELKSTNYWENDTNITKPGRDKYGFKALPAGFCNMDGNFNDIGNSSWFWTSLESFSDYAFYWRFTSDKTELYKTDISKLMGLSIRFVRDY